MKSAVFEVAPLCPECLSMLEKPEFWSKLPREDKFRVFNLFCPRCDLMVAGQFMTGSDSGRF
jgi:hypothetical protein